MRVLVTGSRTWTDEGAVWDALDTVAAAGGGRVLVVHGACPRGADAHASRWARARGVEQESHPADWRAGRRAGMDRNLAMVEAGADLCLAFLDLCMDSRCQRREVHASHGADHCARMASRAGIPVRKLAAADLVDDLFAEPPEGLAEQLARMLAGARERHALPAVTDSRARLQERSGGPGSCQR